MRNVTALLAAGLLTVVGGIAVGQQYQEAPWFAEMVARGELPPVAERLPLEPRQISPDDEFNTYETGRYSDRWVEIVAGSIEETQGLTGEARAGREDQDGNISPWSFKGWEASADNTVWTFSMREGLKWSDGVPYDTEDMQFFLEDIQQRPEYFAATGWSRLNGIVDGMQIDYLDDYRFRITLPEGNASYDGDLLGQSSERWIGGYPKHYLGQFHEAHTAANELAAKVSAAGVESWFNLLYDRKDHYGSVNPDIPVLMPFIVENGVPANPTTWKPNPYYFVVDAENKQLPYTRGRRSLLVSDTEARKLRALAGQVTMYRLPLDAIELAKAEADKGRIQMHVIKIVRNDGLSSGITAFNMSAEDEFKRTLFRDRRFRLAWSYFVPRQKIGDIVYQGQAVPLATGGGIINPEHRWYTPVIHEYDWLNRDVDKANALLDELGLTNRDAEGFRLGPDGKAINFAITVHPLETEWIPAANIILEELHLIGLKATVRTVDWGGAPQIQKEGNWEIWVAQSCDVQIHRWPESMQCAAPTHEGGSFPGQQPTWAIDWHDWLASDGANGEEPPDRIKENYQIWQGLKSATGDELAALYRAWQENAAYDLWVVGHHAWPPELWVLQPGAHGINPATGDRAWLGMWFD